MGEIRSFPAASGFTRRADIASRRQGLQSATVYHVIDAHQDRTTVLSWAAAANTCNLHQEATSFKDTLKPGADTA